MPIKIPICFTFDDNYVIPAAVAFYSLLTRAKKECFFEMFVLHHNISKENQNLLQDIINKTNNATLTFIDTHNFLSAEFEKNSFSHGVTFNAIGGGGIKQFTSDTIIRCFISRFLPQYDKVIYSDVDVVFVDDISKLLEFNLKDKYIAAVKAAYGTNYELSHLSEENYEKFKDSYFAGGIWVLNLKKIREDNLELKMINIINDDTIIKRWNDQDIMNLACDNKVEFLPLNYISYPYLHSFMKESNFISHYSRQELFHSIIFPKIIHYAGHKPWNSTKCYLSQIWWQIFDYLQLPKTKIFALDDDSNSKKINILTKKVKKYKKLFNIFLCLFVILVLLQAFLII